LLFEERSTPHIVSEGRVCSSTFVSYTGYLEEERAHVLAQGVFETAHSSLVWHSRKKTQDGVYMNSFPVTFGRQVNSHSVREEVWFGTADIALYRRVSGRRERMRVRSLGSFRTAHSASDREF
jgi:hypothetical protein